MSKTDTPPVDSDLDEAVVRDLALSDRDTAHVYRALYRREFGELPEEAVGDV